MYKGKYTKATADYSQYRVKLFNPYLYDIGEFGHIGCGASVLALLTGAPPTDIQTLNKDKKHYSDRFVKRFLKEEGFEVIPITQKGLNSTAYQIDYPIRKNHVVLISQLMAKREATWLVYYNNLTYHNFQVGSTEILDFINKPSLSAYIVWHKRWGKLGD